MHRHQISPTPSLETSGPFDATIGSVGFLNRRKPDPDWKIVNHVNRQYDILAYAISGKALYRVADQRLEVSEGNLLFFPKGVVHSGRSDSTVPWSFFSTAFELQFSDPRQATFFATLPRVTAPSNRMELQSLFAEMERLWVARSPAYLLRCRSILLQLMHIFISAAALPNAPAALHTRTIGPVLALLQANIAHDFSVEELADMVHLSPSRFRVLFKKMTGYSAVRYQNWLRINHAKDLLLSGEYTVSQTAEAVGIEDVYYFSRLFKKLTGRNPSYYRNQ
jgi:AraC-like DNA-binding protein/uncharacterized RmlC-like cupin family protein